MPSYVVVPSEAVASASARLSGAREPAPDEHGLKWSRFGDRTIYWNDGAPQSDARRGFEHFTEAPRATQGRLYLVGQLGQEFRETFPSARVVLEAGRYLAVDLTDAEAEGLSSLNLAGFGLVPMPPNATIVEQVARAALAVAAVDARARDLADQVSPGRVAQSLAFLTGCQTRHSLSAGFVRASKWAELTLQQLGYTVTRSMVVIPGGSSSNLVADKAGLGTNRRLVLVTAHLDSINLAGGPDAPAPGADDNGSGIAGVLEIAHILAGTEHDDDLRLVLFGGEEQGLFGSSQYVADLSDADRDRISAVINMDMTASLNSPEPGVLLEGAPVSQPLIDRLAASAAAVTDLSVTISLNPFASDHVPFISAGLPAVLTIEGADSENHNIHSDRDTLSTIDSPLAVMIYTMNLVTVAGLLGLRDSGENQPELAVDQQAQHREAGTDTN